MYMEVKATLMALVILRALVKGSQVIDENSQRTLYPSDYCRKIGVCAEGTHVMCTHFNPNRTKGPLCVGTRDVSINAEYAKLLLDLLNIIRSRTAQGRTAGLGNLTLPRGYGIFQLQWDPELSTIAQVWANTCIISRDMCRATEKFSDPGQVVGITRFDENWLPLNAKALFNYSGFSLEKVEYGIHSTLRSWYRSREDVHPDDISDVSFIWPKHLTSNSFLEIVHGRVTHVGCGISIFVEFDYYTSTTHSVNFFHHIVRVICNLSSRILATPRKDRVYTTDPPTREGYTSKCGCPIGYDENEYCLCYETGRKLPYSCKGKECKPAVVVLPIFTIENAPPSKLNKIRNGSSCKMKTHDVDPDHIDYTRLRRHDLRSSIFLKPSVFELPPRKLKPTKSRDTKLIKKDVSPRRNFADVGKLVSQYLHVRRRINLAENDVKNSSVTVKTIATLPSKFHNISSTNVSKYLNVRRRINFAENDVKDSPVTVKTIATIQSKFHNILSKQIDDKKKGNLIQFDDSTRRRTVNDNHTLTQNTGIDIKSKEDKNNMLMSLLNKLEEEANFVQLDCDRKNELDHKIRKIYNAFMEKAFESQKMSDINKVTDKMVNFGDFLKNERVHKYEEQFDTTREKDIDKAYNDNPISNKQGLRNNKNSMKVNLLDDNTFTYKNNRRLLGVRNVDGLRSIQNNQREKINDFYNETSLLWRDNDMLTLEKRTFYQNKLNSLQRKLRDSRDNRNTNKMHTDQHMRRILPTYHELQKQRKSPYFNTCLDF